MTQEKKAKERSFLNETDKGTTKEFYKRRKKNAVMNQKTFSCSFIQDKLNNYKSQVAC